MRERPRLLGIGQGILPSGYTRAMAGLLEGLAGTFETTLFAVDGLNAEPPPRPYTVRTNRVMGDVYGREQLPGVLEAVEPDAVLIHHDASFHSVHAAALDAYRRTHPGLLVAVLCPTDWLRPVVFRGVDVLVACTRAGRDALAAGYRAAGVRPPRLEVIPLAVDAAQFRPLDRLEARAQLFGERPELDAAFVVLNANRNIRRKRIDLTLRAFAAFARNRPHAYLHLHMGARDSGCDVRALARELGIAGRILMTPHEGRRPDLGDEEMNLMYNACDVGVSTAAAEGFGLVPFEHGATGAAQVVPPHSSYAELWPGHALLADPDAVPAALGRLHDERGLCDELGARARELATSHRFTPDAVAARWRELLCARPAPVAAV